ncbi:MAG TPA: radical SAM protein, partial [Elusimicrobiales bacterium]|nr:radical SAM protein [Elusimicrobiales bacterium]
PEAVIRDPNVDFAVVGEGERTVCELVEALEHGKPLSGITGLVYKEAGVPVFNPPRAVIEDVDSIPFPAWDLVDMEKYFDAGHRHAANPFPASNRVVPVFTSRGCPYGCIYCHNIFGKRIRMRSAENVLREIELLSERYAPDEIEVSDDIFNCDMDRVIRICDGLIGSGSKAALSFPNGLRVDRMDRELVLKLKQAGTKQIYYAIESADPEVQKRIGKNLDLSKAEEIVRFTAGSGIVTGGFFIFGFPGETKEEMRKTVEFAKALPFHVAVFHYLTPRPNTPLEALLRKRGIKLDSSGLHHYKKFSVNLSAVSDAELKRMWAGAYAGFYLRPGQMWRIWKALPDKARLLRRIPQVLGFSITR